MISIGLVNWKIFADKARILTRILVSIFLLYNSMGFLSPIMESTIELIVYMLVNILSFPVSFITLFYIPYTKNKTDIIRIQNRFKQLLFFNILMIAVIVAYIYIAVMYLDNGL